MDWFKLTYLKLKFWYFKTFKNNYWDFNPNNKLMSVLNIHYNRIEEIINEFSGYKTYIIYNKTNNMGLVYCFINKNFINVASFTIDENKEYSLRNDYLYIITLYTNPNNVDVVKAFDYINKHYEDSLKDKNFYKLLVVNCLYFNMKENK
jgi:hypothetical protein